MSLAIDIRQVRAVLLADGWHEVAGRSFDIDAYEYKAGDDLLVGGGSVAGVTSTGFRFNDAEGDVVMGPLTAILAVRRQPLHREALGEGSRT